MVLLNMCMNSPLKCDKQLLGMPGALARIRFINARSPGLSKEMNLTEVLFRNILFFLVRAFHHNKTAMFYVPEKQKTRFSLKHKA